MQVDYCTDPNAITSLFPSSQRSENVWWGNPLNKKLESDHSATNMLTQHPKEKKRTKTVLFPTAEVPNSVRGDPLADRCLSMPKGKVMLGTSIMAITYDGGVVLGADSRTSRGQYVANRVSDKINRLADNVYCCRCGAAADSQAIISIVKYNLAIHMVEVDRNPNVATAANIFKYMLYQNKASLSTAIICAGWDPVQGGSVYSIAGGGTILKVPIMFMGSGSTYIYGMCDANYREGMTKDEAVNFVKKGISHAMSRDGSSGGCIRMVVINKDGVERSFFPGNEVPSYD